jgi:hypothetical protein
MVGNIQKESMACSIGVEILHEYSSLSGRSYFKEILNFIYESGRSYFKGILNFIKQAAAPIPKQSSISSIRAAAPVPKGF